MYHKFSSCFSFVFITCPVTPCAHITLHDVSNCGNRLNSLHVSWTVDSFTQALYEAHQMYAKMWIKNVLKAEFLMKYFANYPHNIFLTCAMYIIHFWINVQCSCVPETMSTRERKSKLWMFDAHAKLFKFNLLRVSFTQQFCIPLTTAYNTGWVSLRRTKSFLRHRACRSEIAPSIHQTERSSFNIRDRAFSWFRGENSSCGLWSLNQSRA